MKLAYFGKLHFTLGLLIWYPAFGGPMTGLYILVDDDFADPIYEDPESSHLEPEAWSQVCTCVLDALEGDVSKVGHLQAEDTTIHWRMLARFGLTFVVVSDEHSSTTLKAYLAAVVDAYLDEVDAVRNPDREGVIEVVLAVEMPDDDDDE